MRWHLNEINNKRIVLLVIALITIIAIPLVLLTGGGFRIAFSLLVLLFCPGYVLLEALFPLRQEIKPIERITLSIGISIAAVAVFGLILHYTPLGLGLVSTFFTTVVFIFILIVISWFRSGKALSKEGKVAPVGSVCLFPRFRKLARIDKSLTVALAAVVIICIGIFCFVAFTPVKGELYTEFYLLDSQGKTINYPDSVVSGDKLEFIAGVISHEESLTEYHIEVFLDNAKVASVYTGILNKDEKWEGVISFVAEPVGENQKVTVWLYKQGESQPYNKDPLHIFLNVIGAGH